MSETVLSKEHVQPAPEAPAKKTEPAPQGRGNGLAVFALLLGAAGVAVGGWGVWQVRQLQAATAEQLSDVPALAAQTLSIKQG
ncbi:MAG: heme biosynthesis operon protein HemX, partial [Pseudomonas sp.]|nr:heme biosynthesis operon protein HemX [Pseudomonas sp.]